jgi:hypothetical protein
VRSDNEYLASYGAPRELRGSQEEACDGIGQVFGANAGVVLD